MRIYLLRHGEIDSLGKMIGQTDLPLNTRGREQYQAIANFLSKKAISALYHSPLRRCAEGAQIIGNSCNTPPQAEPLLSEINLGLWDGMKKSDIQQRYPQGFTERAHDWAGFRPPQGESFSDLQQRAWQGIEKCINHQQQNIAIISHAGVNRCLLATILGKPLADLFSIKQDYGCINTLELTGGKLKLLELNRCLDS